MDQLSIDVPTRLRQVIDASLETYKDNIILAQLAASQACLESALLSKPSTLASQHNNLFGIKGVGTAGTVRLLTSEFVSGKWIKVYDNFCKNLSLSDSFVQHRQFISKPRYAAVWKAISLEDAAVEIHKAGYATDPDYAKKLVSIYVQNLQSGFSSKPEDKKDEEKPSLLSIILSWLVSLFTKKPVPNPSLFNRPRRFVDRVFIHCSDSSNAWVTASVVNEWHKDRGWKGIGYHYFIKTDGTLEIGRNLEDVPAAQEGNNTGTIAICLNGSKLEDFKEVQFDILKRLCHDINKAYSGKVTFRPHNYVSNKTCPVFNMYEVLNVDKEGHIGS